MLSLLSKPNAVYWSGTRNCAIALLLFGRNYKLGNGLEEEIKNPLNLFGDEDERKELRLHLYRLQELRNGFIHHDLAGWDEAQHVKVCFEKCFRKLVMVLYGRNAEEWQVSQVRKANEVKNVLQCAPESVATEEANEILVRKAAPIRRSEKPVGRNDPCPCGSGKKFKKCCMAKSKADPTKN